MSLKILGISASHNASACVMIDGELRAAIQLERISRVKNDGSSVLDSDAAINYCLQAAGLNISNIDLISFNSQAARPEYMGLSRPVFYSDFNAFDVFGERTFFVSHHLCHALSSHFCSGFTNSHSIVIDGSGGTVNHAEDIIITGSGFKEYLMSNDVSSGVHVESIYKIGPTHFELLERKTAKSFMPNSGTSSLGETYASVAKYIFGSWHSSGKVMGLAPWGNPNKFGNSLLVRDSYGDLAFSSDWKMHCNAKYDEADVFKKRHLAARIQTDLELALMQRFEKVLSLSGVDKIVYSGGVAQNCKANYKAMAQIPTGNSFVIPASHDAGICIGAAVAAHYQVSGEMPCQQQEHSEFLGYHYKGLDIEKSLCELGDFFEVRDLCLDSISNDISKGSIIGWFKGGSEFGPRSLGSRSILANPQINKIDRRINKTIKFREDFRPFAPVVIEEAASEYFKLDEKSPYMLKAVPVKPAFKNKLKSVTHIDGTSRVQTVSFDQNSELHTLLKKIKGFTGLPILLNTSFNLRGGPIVESPKDAIDIFISSHIDMLVLEGKMIKLHNVSFDKLYESTVFLSPLVTSELKMQLGCKYTLVQFCLLKSRGYKFEAEVFDIVYYASERIKVSKLHKVVNSKGDIQKSSFLLLLNYLIELRILLVK